MTRARRAHEGGATISTDARGRLIDCVERWAAGRVHFDLAPVRAKAYYGSEAQGGLPCDSRVQGRDRVGRLGRGFQSCCCCWRPGSPPPPTGDGSSSPRPGKNRPASTTRSASGCCSSAARIKALHRTISGSARWRATRTGIASTSPIPGRRPGMDTPWCTTRAATGWSCTPVRTPPTRPSTTFGCCNSASPRRRGCSSRCREEGHRRAGTIRRCTTRCRIAWSSSEVRSISTKRARRPVSSLICGCSRWVVLPNGPVRARTSSAPAVDSRSSTTAATPAW